MLDLKFVRSNPQVVIDALAKRGGKISLDGFLSLEEERRSILGQVEEMKSRRNATSKQVGLMKKNGEDATALMEEARQLGDEIAALDKRLAEVEDALKEQLLNIPNIPHESVPEGVDDAANIEQRRWGEQPSFDFEVKNLPIVLTQPLVPAELLLIWG